MRKITALMITFVLLFSVVSPVGAAYMTYSVLAVPVSSKAPHQDLATIFIDSDYFYLGEGNEAYAFVNLPPDVTIEQVILTDMGKNNRTVLYEVYSKHIQLTVLGTNSETAGMSLNISITADLSNTNSGEISAMIYAPAGHPFPSGMLTLAQIINPEAHLFDQFLKAFTKLKASNKLSSDSIYSVSLNLADVHKGSLTSTLYKTAQETSATKTHSISPQIIETVKRKLTTSLREINQKYGSQDNYVLTEDNYDIITSYVYGSQKTEIITDFLNGIPTVLKIQPSPGGGGGGSSRVITTTATDQPAPVLDSELIAETLFGVSSDTYTLNGETMTMDVKPYIKNNRTYVPVRYLAYALGVQENDITWDSESRKITITKGNIVIELIIGSPVMRVNGKPVTMDVSPEITDGRTMLPARWVAETLGAAVEWDNITQQAIIKIP